MKHVYGKGRRNKTDVKLLPSIDEMTAEEGMYHHKQEHPIVTM